MILVQSIIKRLRIWFLFIDAMSWFGLLNNPDTRWQNLPRTRDNSWYTKVRLPVANFWTRRKSDSGYACVLLADIRRPVRWNVNNFPRSLLQFLSGYPELPICIRSFFFFSSSSPSFSSSSTVSSDVFVPRGTLENIPRDTIWVIEWSYLEELSRLLGYHW